MSTLAARRKQQHYRKRQLLGLAVLRVPVLHVELAEALIASGRLSAGETLDRLAVEHEAGAILAEWAEQWRNFC